MSGGNPLARLDAHAVHRRLVELGEAWAEYGATASLLDDLSKTTLARLTLDRMGEATSKAHAETMALASDEYEAHLREVADAKRAAQKALVHWKSALMWSDLLRSQNANRREEMKLGGMVP